MLSGLLAVVGVGLLVVAGWCRLGRTEGARWWVGARQTERMALVTVPMAGLTLLGAAMLAGDGGWRTAGACVTSTAMLVFLLFNPVGLPMPAWTLPTWFQVRAARRVKPNAKRPSQESE